MLTFLAFKYSQAHIFAEKEEKRALVKLLCTEKRSHKSSHKSVTGHVLQIATSTSFMFIEIMLDFFRIFLIFFQIVKHKIETVFLYHK